MRFINLSFSHNDNALSIKQLSKGVNGTGFSNSYRPSVIPCLVPSLIAKVFKNCSVVFVSLFPVSMNRSTFFHWSIALQTVTSIILKGALMSEIYELNCVRLRPFFRAIVVQFFDFTIVKSVFRENTIQICIDESSLL